MFLQIRMIFAAFNDRQRRKLIREPRSEWDNTTLEWENKGHESGNKIWKQQIIEMISVSNEMNKNTKETNKSTKDINKNTHGMNKKTKDMN